MLRLLSQQWSALGVALEADPAPEAVIDPEALLWCTLEGARYDPRLFGEVLDWLSVNHGTINFQRLRRIGPPMSDIRWRILAAIATKVASRPGASKWKRIVERQVYRGLLGEADPLFLAPDGRPLPVGAPLDRDFREFGIGAAVLETRGKSRPVDLTEPAALVVRARALFGLNAKAETWAALLVRLGAFHSDLVAQTGFAFGTVGDALEGFVKCGICREERRVKAKWYCLVHREQWKSVLSLDFFPPWPDWIRTFRWLVSLLRKSLSLRREGASEYVFASELRQAFQEAKKDLVAADFGVTSPSPENYLAPEFLARFNAFSKELLDKALFLGSP